MAGRPSGNFVMANAVRQIDVIDTAPKFTPESARALDEKWAGVETTEMLRGLLANPPFEDLALVSSFGAESAVLLHIVSQIDKSLPLIFVNTQKMFGETLAYRDELAERLGFVDLRVYRPDPYLLAQKDATGLRWNYDPDGCCDIRKVDPLRRALNGFDAWLSGRKGFQSGTRTALPRFEADEGRLKINPLVDWDKAQLDAYFDEHKLPHHPLEAQGYLSIGCAPCTSKVADGEDPRAGRWRGWDKVECGIHTPEADDPVF
jgi:phosphoadenosine phosphosulfate reductase